MSDAIKLPADQVHIDGDRVVVMADAEQYEIRQPCWTDQHPHVAIGKRPPAWMTAAGETCPHCSGTGTTDKGHPEPGLVCGGCHRGKPILTVEAECDHRDCMPEELGTEWVCRYWQNDGLITYRLTASEVLPIVKCVGAFASFDDFEPQPAILWHPDNVYGVPPKVLTDGTLATTALPPATTPGQFALIGEVVR